MSNDHQLRHLAIIMDGNRRFARAQNLMPWMGHKKGVEAVRTAISFCLKHTISYLSLYAFSLENFNRSQAERNFLFSLMIESIDQHKESLCKEGVRVRFVGDRSQFPQTVRQAYEDLEALTSHNNKLSLQILFCYGGQQEVVAAAAQLARDIARGKIDPTTISAESFKKYLWMPAIPDPDLIVRTGGLQRLSNFLLYQAAYAELYFTDTYWPAITEHDLDQALAYFNQAQRNFGS